MTVRIDATDLLAATKFAGRVIMHSKADPIAESVFISNDTMDGRCYDGIVVKARNTEGESMTAVVDGVCDTDIDFAVNYDELVTFLQDQDRQSAVDLEVDDVTKSRLNITVVDHMDSNHTTLARLQGWDRITWKAFARGDFEFWDGWRQIDAALLHNAFKEAVSFTKSVTDNKKAGQNFGRNIQMFQDGPKDVRVSATDGVRLYYSDVPVTSNEELPEQVNIPTYMARRIIKLLKSAKPPTSNMDVQVGLLTKKVEKESSIDHVIQIVGHYGRGGKGFTYHARVNHTASPDIKAFVARVDKEADRSFFVKNFRVQDALQYFLDEDTCKAVFVGNIGDDLVFIGDGVDEKVVVQVQPVGKSAPDLTLLRKFDLAVIKSVVDQMGDGVAVWAYESDDHHGTVLATTESGDKGAAFMPMHWDHKDKVRDDFKTRLDKAETVVV